MGILNWFGRLIGIRQVSGPSAPAESPDLKTNKPGEELREQDPSGIPWRLAPSGSHVESFRFFDARKMRLLRLTTGKSEIHVRFRTKAEYAYYSPSHETLAEIFAKLASDRHPGKVIWSDLRAKFQYRQLVAGSVKWRPPKQARKRKGGTHGRRKGAKRRKR